MRKYYFVLLIMIFVSCSKEFANSTSDVNEAIQFYKLKGGTFYDNNTGLNLSTANNLTNNDYVKLKSLDFLVDLSLPKGITDEIMNHVKYLEKLEVLRIDSSNITDNGLSKIGNLRKLRFIDLNSTKISDASLLTIQKLPNIERIHLDYTKISDGGLKNLIGSVNLYEISLNKTSITDKGLMFLSNIKSLRAINVLGTKVTLEGVNNFKKVMPNIDEINFDY